VSDADRLARVALSRLTEPGEPRIAALVAQLGAVGLLQALSDPAQPSSEARDVASRLRDLDAEADLAHAARLGLRYVVPGDAEWPAQVDDLRGPFGIARHDVAQPETRSVGEEIGRAHV